VGVNAKKLTKSKAVLIVEILSPQSRKDTAMQIYCTNLEPKRGLGQGADLSVLTAIKYTLLHAASLYDIGVRPLSASDVTRAIIADFSSLHRGLIYDASHITPAPVSMRHPNKTLSTHISIFVRHRTQ